MRVLVTGGAGYVGSHVVAELLERGDDIVVLDDLSNGFEEAVERAGQIAGRRPVLEVGDLCEPSFLRQVFARHRIDAVVHCAALKSVAESVARPDLYDYVNVDGTLRLARAMQEYGVSRIVFASSGSVYGETDSPAIHEDAPLAPYSPYARTKAEGEQVLADFGAPRGWGVVVLRFFNVCGAHPSGELGEFAEKSANLMPALIRQLESPRPRLDIFGNDYPTRDGTCIRDYVHVVDVAQAIAAALDRTAEGTVDVYNVGTGAGTTVLEMLEAVRKASGVPIEAQFVARRAGDVSACVASVDRAREELGWEASFDVGDMAESALRWMRSRQAETA